MLRLASFLTALWVSSANAQFGFVKDFGKVVTNEVQAVADPAGQAVGFIGGSLCNGVKPIFGVAYENYDKEPDMSKLTLVYQNSNKTVIYNLLQAATEIPKETWFNNTDVLKIYFHGFTDNPMKDSFQTMRNAFATQGVVNILALDASSLIAFFYLRASTVVRFIGERVAEILAALVKFTHLDPANIHLIGHSLGSHICGFLGQRFRELTGYSVGRISGLDPAGPCFAKLEDSLRLSKDDAIFVDAIHTDGGVYGLKEQVGHVDYYPNGGSEQPGCLFQTCSHSRAWELFAESVKNCTALITVKCGSYEAFRKGLGDYNDTSVMGFCASKLTRGTYYLQTNGEEPYGRGELGLTYSNDVGLVRNVKNTVFDILWG